MLLLEVIPEIIQPEEYLAVVAAIIVLAIVAYCVARYMHLMYRVHMTISIVDRAEALSSLAAQNLAFKWFCMLHFVFTIGTSYGEGKSQHPCPKS